MSRQMSMMAVLALALALFVAVEVTDARPAVGKDKCCVKMNEAKPYCCAGFAGSDCVDFPGCTPGDCSDQCAERPPDECCLKLNKEAPFCCAGFAGNLCVSDPFCTPADDCSDLCKDPCQQEPGVVGPCDGAFPRWTFNPDTAKCEKFSYGGCGGNENNFETAAECKKQCGGPPDDCCDEGQYCCPLPRGGKCVKDDVVLNHCGVHPRSEGCCKKS